MNIEMPLWSIVLVLGAVGGFLRHIFSNKGRVTFPHWDGEWLNLGFLYNLIFGAVFGVLTPYGLGAILSSVLPGVPLESAYVTAVFAGGFSVDLFENALEKVLIYRNNRSGAMPDRGIPI